MLNSILFLKKKTPSRLSWPGEMKLSQRGTEQGSKEKILSKFFSLDNQYLL